MEFETVRIDGEGAIRHLVLNRPEVHNAVNGQLVADVHEATRLLDADPSVRVVIIRGEGKSLCSGADLKQPRTSTQDAMLGSKHGATMYDALLHMNPITIALCHGYMIGGGAVLPAACDFRIGSPTVNLTLNEISIGFNLTWHSLPALVNLVGPHRAKEMLILGRTYNLNELNEFGYFTDIVDDDEALLAAGEQLGAEIVKQPPVPVTVTKASINAQAMPLGRAIQHLDHLAVGYMGKSENSRVARNTYFDDKPRNWGDD
ncbi:MAG: enoyl-CoA hydratase/isomerase family protein [Actinomycetota bacterium]|jgi:enoyl-CoA hydratase/carnithine racemase|nr:enoyl-CoA hydratase/isomerase family protein [Actinomycetota bacterium]MED5361406.1 enoyl-CoA hydratase/isomerase family protein [Actinomycetota bacterium]